MTSVLAFVGCEDPLDAEPRLRCDPAVEGSRRALIERDLWRVATPKEGPWIEFRPPDIECPDGSRLAEDFAGTHAYGIITSRCRYTTLFQETLADGCKGESLYIWLWNYAQAAPENSTATLGVELGATEWSETRPIPGPAALVAKEIILQDDVPRGSPIFFHVRNHGSNSYELLDLIFVVPGDTPRPGG
ncbi:MAG: hypothetical protein JNJ59_16020 [Deltaproteobacteria bacterium]|nr:hypothetical protein [Deltaproteobacteria bacterium]